MREGRGFAIRTLQEHNAGLGSDEDIPAWKKEAKELMAGLRNELSESRSQWAQENATRTQETRDFMAELRADFGHTRPGEEPPDLQEVDCGYCSGRGSLPGTIKCPVCWGKGRVRVKAPYEKCDLCRGTGHVPGLALTCRKCRGKGWMHVKREPNACPRCGGSGLEPVEEISSLAALRKRRRMGLPPPRRKMTRPVCEVCYGAGVVDWLGDQAARTGSGELGAGGESEATAGQERAEPAPNSRDAVPLEEKLLGYIMSSLGASPEDMEAIFGMSETEVGAALKSLAHSRRARVVEGLYYPTRLASLGPRSPKVSDKFSSEAKEFVGRLLRVLRHARGREAHASSADTAL